MKTKVAYRYNGRVNYMDFQSKAAAQNWIRFARKDADDPVRSARIIKIYKK